MHRGCFVWTLTPCLSDQRTPRPGPVRVCLCPLFLAGWADRPPGRVLVRLTFPLAVLSCCFAGPPPDWDCPCCVFVFLRSFFLFLCFFFAPRYLRPRCLRLFVLSGPGCPWPWRFCFLLPPPPSPSPRRFFCLCCSASFFFVSPPQLPPPCTLPLLCFFVLVFSLGSLCFLGRGRRAGGALIAPLRPLGACGPRCCVSSGVVDVSSVCCCWGAGVCRLGPACCCAAARSPVFASSFGRASLLLLVRSSPVTTPPAPPMPLFLVLCGRLCALVLLCRVCAPSCLFPPWLCSVLLGVRVVLPFWPCTVVSCGALAWCALPPRPSPLSVLFYAVACCRCLGVRAVVLWCAGLRAVWGPLPRRVVLLVFPPVAGLSRVVWTSLPPSFAAAHCAVLIGPWVMWCCCAPWCFCCCAVSCVLFLCASVSCGLFCVSSSAFLCCAVLCRAYSCRAVRCAAMLCGRGSHRFCWCRAGFCCAVLFGAVLCCVWCRGVLLRAVACSLGLCGVVVRCVVWCAAVRCSAVLVLLCSSALPPHPPPLLLPLLVVCALRPVVFCRVLLRVGCSAALRRCSRFLVPVLLCAVAFAWCRGVLLCAVLFLLAFRGVVALLCGVVRLGALGSFAVFFCPVLVLWCLAVWCAAVMRCLWLLRFCWCLVVSCCAVLCGACLGACHAVVCCCALWHFLCGCVVPWCAVSSGVSLCPAALCWFCRPIQPPPPPPLLVPLLSGCALRPVVFPRVLLCVWCCAYLRWCSLSCGSFWSVLLPLPGAVVHCCVLCCCFACSVVRL